MQCWNFPGGECKSSNRKFTEHKANFQSLLSKLSVAAGRFRPSLLISANFLSSSGVHGGLVAIGCSGSNL